MNVFPKLDIKDLNIPIPIIQGGMGIGISLSGLASAVAEAGGVGVISAAGIGMGQKDYGSNFIEANSRALREEIRKAKEKTKGVLGVNIMVAMNNFQDMVKTAVDEAVDIIFSGAGLPLDLPKYLEGKEFPKLAPIVSSARAASVICKKWSMRFNRLPDAVVVEGPKAGGHLGFSPEQIEKEEFKLEHLVPDVVAALAKFTQGREPIPVIAAGGIFTHDDIKKFMGLGASAVQLGTRFVATHECDADINFKQAYVESKKEDIKIMKSPVGMPGRAIRNGFLDSVEEGNRHPKACPFECLRSCKRELSEFCITNALMNAKLGKLKNALLFAGENAHRVKNIVSVKELFAELTGKIKG